MKFQKADLYNSLSLKPLYDKTEDLVINDLVDNIDRIYQELEK